MTVAKQIEAGAVLVATPPRIVGGRWTYRLDKEVVLLTTDDILAVQRSQLIHIEKLAGEKLLYRAMTKAERKAMRAQRRAWREEAGK